MKAHLKAIATLSALLGFVIFMTQHPMAAVLTAFGVLGAAAFALIYLLILEAFQD